MLSHRTRCVTHLELREEFEYIPGGLSCGHQHGFKNAIAGADEAIIVTTPEIAAVRMLIGLLDFSKLLSSITRLIINRIRPQMVRKGDMMGIDDIIDILAIEFLGVVPMMRISSYRKQRRASGAG